MGSGDAGWLNTKRYDPPVRTSFSHDTNSTPKDVGAHHRFSNSGVVHAR